MFLEVHRNSCTVQQILFSYDWSGPGLPDYGLWAKPAPRSHFVNNNKNNIFTIQLFIW